MDLTFVCFLLKHSAGGREAVGTPPPAGDEAPPRGHWIVALRARVFRVGSVPVISAVSPGCPGADEVVREQVPITTRFWLPMATTGFLLPCADFAAPTVFPRGATVLQNSIHATRQGMRNGGLGQVGFLAAAQAVIAPRERMTILHGHVGSGHQGPAQPARAVAGNGAGDLHTSPLS